MTKLKTNKTLLAAFLAMAVLAVTVCCVLFANATEAENPTPPTDQTPAEAQGSGSTEPTKPVTPVTPDKPAKPQINADISSITVNINDMSKFPCPIDGQTYDMYSFKRDSILNPGAAVHLENPEGVEVDDWDTGSSAYIEGPVMMSEDGKSLVTSITNYTAGRYYGVYVQTKFRWDATWTFSENLHIECNKTDNIVPLSIGGKTASFVLILGRIPHAPITRTKIAKVETENAQYTYTGQAIEPNITVTDTNGNKIEKGFTTTFENNVEVGTAKVTVKGDGDEVVGEASATFEIVKSDAPGGGGSEKADGTPQTGDMNYLAITGIVVCALGAGIYFARRRFN